MTENEISGVIVDLSYKIHKNLGPGLFETVYETILHRELEQAGLKVVRQVGIPIRWKELSFDEGFRADLIIEDKVIVELKSLESLASVHGKQLLTYLKLSGMKLGLLINFGEVLIKNGIKRIVNGLPE